MYAIAIFEQSSLIRQLYKCLYEEGCDCEIISIPCKLSNAGCEYCLKFRSNYKKMVIEESAKINMAIKEMYKIVKDSSMNVNYEKMNYT